MKVEFSRTNERTDWPMALALILGICGLIRFGPCQHSKSSRTINDTITIVEYDTVPRIIKAPAEVKIVYDTATLPGKIDTIEVIRSYYTRHIYNRSFLDSEISINQVDTVFENQIYSGPLEYKILRPVSNTSIIKQDRKNEVEIGLICQLFKVKDIGPIIQVHSKNSTCFMGYGLLNKNFCFGITKKVTQ